MTEDAEIEVVPDGHITIETRELAWQQTYDGSRADGYVDQPVAYHFPFKDIVNTNYGMEGIRIKLHPQENGQETYKFWPWTSVIKIDHTTNSTEVTEKLEAKQREEEQHAYAEWGAEMLENLINGHGPHGPGCSCPDPAVIRQEQEECDHPETVKTINDIWTCLHCGAQWLAGDVDEEEDNA